MWTHSIYLKCGLCLCGCEGGEGMYVERARDGEITCMLKTSSELSDCPVMLLTSLEA